MIPIATLNGADLPIQFSYRPYVPAKRNSVSRTVNAVIIQSSDPQIVHGDQSLSWRIEAATPPEFFALWNLYITTTPTVYEFRGYWGEVLNVYFTNFDEPTVRSRLFELAGQFQVLEITTGYSPECGF